SLACRGLLASTPSVDSADSLPALLQAKGSPAPRRLKQTEIAIFVEIERRDGIVTKLSRQLVSVAPPIQRTLGAMVQRKVGAPGPIPHTGRVKSIVPIKTGAFDRARPDRDARQICELPAL